MKYLCIIPVREGSKRFPRKNTSLINGLELYKYTYQQALRIFPREHIIINTDDQFIIDACAQSSMQCYQRPKILGTDTASTAEVLKDFVCNCLTLEANDVIVLFQATNPLRKKAWVQEMMDIMDGNQYSSVVSFSPLKEKKFGVIREQQYIPESYSLGQRSQDIEQRYFENGLIYMTKVSEIKQGRIFTDNMYPFITDDICATVDIDYPEDLTFANFLIQSGLYCEDF